MGKEFVKILAAAAVILLFKTAGASAAEGDDAPLDADAIPAQLRSFSSPATSGDISQTFANRVVLFFDAISTSSGVSDAVKSGAAAGPGVWADYKFIRTNQTNAGNGGNNSSHNFFTFGKNVKLDRFSSYSLGFSYVSGNISAIRGGNNLNISNLNAAVLYSKKYGRRRNLELYLDGGFSVNSNDGIEYRAESVSASAVSDLKLGKNFGVKMGLSSSNLFIREFDNKNGIKFKNRGLSSLAATPSAYADRTTRIFDRLSLVGRAQLGCDANLIKKRIRFAPDGKKNIFDDDYFLSFSGNLEMGKKFSLGLSYKFLENKSAKENSYGLNLTVKL
ncbi:MAG: hypothetical protein LBB09_02855 [Rickettsiales bacterium]|jgi:hypothetical protein|nr:hypothetical protein [Rickettsiales bacterium]